MEESTVIAEMELELTQVKNLVKYNEKLKRIRISRKDIIASFNLFNIVQSLISFISRASHSIERSM